MGRAVRMGSRQRPRGKRRPRRMKGKPLVKGASTARRKSGEQDAMETESHRFGSQASMMAGAKPTFLSGVWTRIFSGSVNAKIFRAGLVVSALGAATTATIAL